MKILVIQLKQIGDVLLSTPVANTLKKNYPDAKVDYIAYNYTKGVLIKNPYIDNIIEVTDDERNSKLKFLKKLFYIRKQKYDIIINVQGKLEGALILFFSGAKTKIGENRKGWRLFNTKSIDIQKTRIISGIGNTVDDRLALLKGLDENIKLFTEYKIWIENIEINEMKNKMLKAGIDFNKPIITFGITSRRYYRIWPMEYYEKLANFLLEKYDAQIIPFFAPNEKEYIMKFYNKMNQNKQIFINIETKNVRDLCKLLKNSNFYIGNDNGPRHFSQAVSTPTLCIFTVIYSRNGFVPHNNEKHQAITFKEAYNLNNEDTIKLHSMSNEEIGEKVSDIKPEIVIKKAEEMIENLSLFGKKSEKLDIKIYF